MAAPRRVASLRAPNLGLGTSLSIPGRAHLADQLTRPSLSIVLNIAEGAGKYHKPDKRRFYLTATGSATESAAILDIALRLRLIDEVRHGRGKDLLNRIVAMLVKLATALENAAP